MNVKDVILGVGVGGGPPIGNADEAAQQSAVQINILKVVFI